MDGLTMKRARDLTVGDLREIVAHVQSILWREDGQWNINKLWDVDTVEMIASTLEVHGLKPTEQDEENATAGGIANDQTNRNPPPRCQRRIVEWQRMLDAGGGRGGSE